MIIILTLFIFKCHLQEHNELHNLNLPSFSAGQQIKLTSGGLQKQVLHSYLTPIFSCPGKSLKT